MKPRTDYIQGLSNINVVKITTDIAVSAAPCSTYNKTQKLLQRDLEGKIFAGADVLLLPVKSKAVAVAEEHSPIGKIQKRNSKLRFGYGNWLHGPAAYTASRTFVFININGLKINFFTNSN